MEKENCCLNLTGIVKEFVAEKGRQRVLDGLSMQVMQGEFVAIVGRSGCGKSTLLRIMAGLEFPDGGTAMRGGSLISGTDRSCSMMFQEPRLFPWMNVGENLAFALPEGADGRDRIGELLRLVGLSGLETAMPVELAGGMAQRAALARSLMNQPSLLLLDEPFSALDALSRLQLQEEFSRIWQLDGGTKVLVTHDIEEAIFLADRIFFMELGRLAHELSVELSRPRQRMSREFQAYRQKVYQWFFK